MPAMRPKTYQRNCIKSQMLADALNGFEAAREINALKRKGSHAAPNCAIFFCAGIFRMPSSTAAAVFLIC